MEEKVKVRFSGLAIAGLICAVLGLLAPFVGIVLAILGLVFGLVALRKIDRSNGVLQGRGMAVAAVIVGAIGTVLYALLLLVTIPAYQNAKARARTAATLGNMAGIETALKIYEMDTGKYPETLAVLASDSSGKGPYLNFVSKDAWGRDYIYRLKPPDSYELFSAGSDGIAGNKDDVKSNHS